VGAIGFVAAVLAVMVAALVVWFIHHQAVAAQVPLATSVGPQAIVPGTGQGADVAGAAGSGSTGR
jgi:hypothetical protein